MTATTTVNKPIWLRLLYWVPNLIAGIILLQTLFFKFSGAAESVYIFTTVGAEPYGRLGSGVLELIASVLMLWPTKNHVLQHRLGALLAIGLMSGAIISHLTILGIEVMGDGGELFYLAVTVLLMSAIILLRSLGARIKYPA